MLRRIFIALTAALVAISGALAGARPIKAAPTAQASALPTAACTLSGATRTCELWAKAGTLGLPGNPSLPIWGFSESAGAPARLPGPTISAQEGETLVVILHNELAAGLSLAVPAIEAAPDRAGAAAGADVTYTFADVAAGTYLYQAGPTAQGDRQTAMGLYGGLVVRAASPGTAYGSAATAFDREALLIYSEVDPALNAAPTTFQLQRFRPRFGLINGKVYPNTEVVGAIAGKTLLLRQINAGIAHHTLGLLGLRQQIIAEDAAPRVFPYTTVAETLPPGKSLDALVRVPATAAAGARYPLYDTAMPQRNSTQLGGMLTFVEVLAGDFEPPMVSALTVTPDATSTTDVALSATISDAGLGDSTIAAAEYSLESVVAAGSGTPMALGAAGVSTTASATIAVAGLADGTHTVYVRGKDSADNWSAPASVTFLVDTTGPVAGGPSVVPSPSTGAGDLSLSATASDALSAVAAAEYFSGADPGVGLGTAMTVGVGGALSATIAAADLAGLPEGATTLSLRAQDALGNWGALVTASFVIDRTGPATSGMALLGSALTATASDVLGTVAAGEYFIGADPGVGLGTAMAAADGAFDSASEGLSATIGALAPGSYTVSARARDALGTWGLAESLSFTVVDEAAPVVSGLALDTTTGVLSANATDVASTVAAAEYSLDGGAGVAMAAADGAFDSASEGLAATLDLGALALGSHTVAVRAQDSAGNWSDPLSTGFMIVDGVAPVVSGLALDTTTGALSANATDVASTVAAAEYSLDGGAGVAMAAADGAFDSASEGLAATLNLAALAPGSHTVAVRAQDSAGNWSDPLSTGFTVVAPPLFSDGFEGGNTSAWTGVGGTAVRLTVTTGAAMNGTTRGLAASIASGTSGYVISTLGTTQPTYRARFFVNPTGVAMNTTWRRIFSAYNSTNGTAEVYRIEMRRQTNGTYQVRAVVTRQGGTTATTAVNISGATRLEAAWQRGAATTFTLKAGATTVTLGNLNTNLRAGVRSVRMGPQGSLTGVAGTMAFDEFVATSGAAIP